MEIAKSVSDFLELPYSTAMDIPKIVLQGTYCVCIENYSALLEYKKENIKLKYKGGVIEICGDMLEIRSIAEGIIEISGKISGIRFI